MWIRQARGPPRDARKQKKRTTNPKRTSDAPNRKGACTKRPTTLAHLTTIECIVSRPN